MYSCFEQQFRIFATLRDDRDCDGNASTSILHSVKKTFVVGAVASLLLAGCGGGTQEAQKITAARQALLYAGQLMRTGKISQDIFRPSALLGIQVSLFLARTAESSVKTALQGVEIQQALRKEDGEQKYMRDINLPDAAQDARTGDNKAARVHCAAIDKGRRIA